MKTIELSQIGTNCCFGNIHFPLNLNPKPKHCGIFKQGVNIL